MSLGIFFKEVLSNKSTSIISIFDLSESGGENRSLSLTQQITLCPFSTKIGRSLFPIYPEDPVSNIFI